MSPCNMRANKRVLCNIEKDETNGEALEHPQDKAISLDDQIEEEEPEPRGMSLNSGTSSLSTAQPKEQRRLPCQRCFRRMIQQPDHVCVLEPDTIKCKHCRSVNNPCLEVSDWIGNLLNRLT